MKKEIRNITKETLNKMFDNRDKTILITTEHLYGKEEWYIDIFKCPKCQTKNPITNNYCGGCGAKIKITYNASKN